MNVFKKSLRGGLGGGEAGSVEVLEKARENLAKKREVFLKFPSKVTAKADGRMTGQELAKYVDDLAGGAYDFITTVVRPFLRQLDKDVQEVGEEILADQCEDGDDTNEARREDYESTVEALRFFSPENDGTLRCEAEVEGRRQFVEALCVRVRYKTELGLLIDDLINAQSKDTLEQLIKDATNAVGKDAQKVFTVSRDPKAPIWAFGQGYDLTKGCFCRYQEFALEQLSATIKERSRELATAHADAQKKREQEVTASSAVDRVSPEELLFGDTTDVNGKKALLSWDFQGHKNALLLSRSDDRLYIIDAVGKPLEALEDMREQWNEPFVSRRFILTKDGESLCRATVAGEKLRYEFGGFVNRESFPMACWIRTAAGACVPSRLLPDDGSRQAVLAVSSGVKPSGNGGSGYKPPAKASGELLTDREFLYFHGLGDYRLKFLAGFKHQPRDEDEKPVGEETILTKDGEALICRIKDADGKFWVALRDVSSEELRQLLEASGAVVGHRFLEGVKGNSLPKAIKNGIGLAFGRLKNSEK